MAAVGIAAAATTVLGWVFIVAIFGTIAAVYACLVRQGDPFDIRPGADRDDDVEAVTALGLAHPAARALTQCRVDKVLPFDPPDRIVEAVEDGLICADLEHWFRADEQRRAQTFNREIDQLPNRTQPGPPP